MVHSNFFLEREFYCQTRVQTMSRPTINVTRSSPTLSLSQIQEVWTWVSTIIALYHPPTPNHTNPYKTILNQTLVYQETPDCPESPDTPFLQIANYLLPISNCPLPIAHYQLSIAHCKLEIVHIKYFPSIQVFSIIQLSYISWPNPLLWINIFVSGRTDQG